MAERIYFNAVFGGLGGLLGWMLFGVLGDRAAPADRVMAQLAFGGALIGGAIGYLLVGADALRDRSALRFFRLGTYGVLLGAAGGSAGMVLGDLVLYQLVPAFGSGGRGGLPAVVGAMLVRGLGWMVLGAAVGLSEGVAARSLGKLSYGLLGGALGGFVGGALFGLAVELARGRGEHGPLWQALGLVILGAAIGALTALVQAAFQPASVRIVRGWQEGREYGLSRANNLLGRDEHADVALFRDMRVQKRHAFIRHEGRKYVLVNGEAAPGETLVNGDPLTAVRDLQDGDRIELGGVLLRFQLRGTRPPHSAERK